tara:strand:- start:7139 stop:8158 length:1020 start_codon:yes stop_codon:yes gene_type:complete
MLKANVEWSGFGSFYLTKSMNESYFIESAESTQTEFTRDSFFGLNLSSSLSDKMRANAQFVAKTETGSPNENFDLAAKWAFVTYGLNNKFYFTIGRQLIPFVLANEYASVGFLLPYRKIPSLFTQTIPFSGFDGLALDYKVGSSHIILYGGTANLSFSSEITDVEGTEGNVLGFTYRRSVGLLDVQLGYLHSEPDLDLTIDGVEGVQAKGNFNNYSLGLQWKRNNNLIWIEGINRVNHNEVDGGIGKTLNSAYLIYGYTMDNWMPRLTYSQSYWDLDGVDLFESAIEVGFNYKLGEQILFKADYVLHNKLQDDNPLGASTVVGNEKSGDLVSLGVDFIF